MNIQVKNILNHVLESINDPFMDSNNISDIITNYIEFFYKYTLKISDKSNLELEYVYKYVFLSSNEESCWDIINLQIQKNDIPINHNIEYSCLQKENVLSHLIKDTTQVYFGPQKCQILKCLIFDNYDMHIYY
jgi:hypothetical protein